MPSTLSTLEIGFPRFRGGETAEKKIDTVTNYLYQLLEQLRYALNNLDEGNFNETGLREITGPINSKIEDVHGRFSSLKQTVEGWGFETNGGITTITGAEIKSGKIIGSTFQCERYENSGVTQGNLDFLYYKGEKAYKVGTITIDDQGLNDYSSNKYRLFIKTFSTAVGDFSIKIESSGNSSYESTLGFIRMKAKNNVRIVPYDLDDVFYEFKKEGIYYGGKCILTT